MPEMDGRPIVLIVGNEVCGVDPGILDQCEKIFSIPMQGVKTSLNTAVAFGIAVYSLRLHLH
jgi:tRNA G18 (ribose-2'-O)-methylase SpoU